jgi:sugar phosphate isomerase/epimerase
VETAGLYGRTPAQFRKMLDDVGLVACSAHIAVPTKDNVSEIVDAAGALGYEMVISGRGPDNFKTADSARAVGDEFQAAAELLRPHGLKLGYHNHWWEFEELGGRLAMELLAERMPSVFLELDTYWASNFGKVDVPAFIRRHAGRIPLMHIKDGPLVEDRPHTAVGAGKVDVPAVIRAADAKVLRWLIVELDECATDMMQAVRHSADFLAKAKLGKHRGIESTE